MRMMFSVCCCVLLVCNALDAAQGADNTPPQGYQAIFNGQDLIGWKGFLNISPAKKRKLSPEQLASKQKELTDKAHQSWSVEDGVLVYSGKGRVGLVTEKDYGDFELYVDWKIPAKGDSGIYLRDSPQVQIWENPVGSGGLYNNKSQSKPLVKADNPIGEWNTFWIKMVGENVTVKLNGKLVVDNVPLENYWERQKPIYEKGGIALQDHGSKLWFRNIYLRELPRTK